MRSPRTAFPVVFAAIFLFLAAGSLAAQETQEKEKQDKTAAPQFAGSDTCAVCHEELHTRFLKTPHAVVEKSEKLKRVGQACESCHGPGTEHADAGGDKSKIFSFKTATKPQQEAACLKCHGMQATHGGTEVSLHRRGGGPSCMDCHSIHAAAGARTLLKNQPAKLCLSCHIERQSDFRRPFHHKVLEGGMSCIDCHQPHGGPLAKQLKSASGTPMPCVRCHSDKAGPFVFEHGAVRFGDCLACHVPHGSTNPKLLVRNTVASLCLECHSFTPGIPGAQPPAFHDIRTARYQNCTTCHVKIHGSNASNIFFK